MVEQPEILQHDADPFAQIGNLVLAQQGDVVAEQVDQAASRPQRQEQELQQRGLAGARGPGEKLEGMGWNLEVEIAQDLGPQAIAQSDIFEPNQVSAPFASGLARTRQNGSRDA